MHRKLIATASAFAVSAILLGGTPAAHADTYPVVAKASWVNDTLSVTYTEVITPGNGEDEVMQVVVDGQVVYDPIDLRRGESRTFQMTPPRNSIANVQVVGQNCSEEAENTTCTATTVYSAKLTQQVVTPKRGQVSANDLLDELPVAAASHASTFTSSKFAGWIDADHDGENTRTEVLKAESATRTTGRTGSWTSAYDGKTYTGSSGLEIDHLVPLSQAWVSGAYRWSAKQRAAYSNDLGYSPSLIAVSAQERKTKGEQSPVTYLPPKASYRCTYVRNYISVKYRWNLAVTPAEKTVLQNDLAIWCTNPYVTRPTDPNVAQLAG